MITYGSAPVKNAPPPLIPDFHEEGRLDLPAVAVGLGRALGAEISDECETSNYRYMPAIKEL